MESDSHPNIYQVAGVDELDRGFNRQAEMRTHEGQFQAIFRYEKFRLEADTRPTEAEALTTLVAQLHERGYTQLRTRLHFREGQYLGNQEIWDEHDDPSSPNPFHRLWAFFTQWKNRGKC